MPETVTNDCSSSVNTCVYENALDAFRAVDKNTRRNGFIMLGAAGVTLAVGMLSRLIWLAQPTLDKIYAGTGVAVYYAILIAIFACYAAGLNYFLKRIVGIRLFANKSRTIDDKQAAIRALIIIALGATAVFIASACNNFTLKLQTEMGLGITAETAIFNILVYVFYGLHLWLGFIAADLFQRGMSSLFPAQRSIPFGAVFLVTVFGLTELLLELYTTTHLFSVTYYLFTYVYAAIYELTGRNYRLSYWASLAVMVL